MELKEFQESEFEFLTEGKDESVRIRFPWIKTGSKNLNNRVYSKSIIKKEIERVQNKIAEGSFWGASAHPAKGVAEVDDVAFLITKLEMKGDTGMAEAKLLPNQKGKNLIAILKSGGSVGASARGHGTTTRKADGVDYVDDDYRLSGIDAVLNQSEPTARFSQKNIFESVALDNPEPRLTKQKRVERLYRNARLSGYRKDMQTFTEELGTTKKEEIAEKRYAQARRAGFRGSKEEYIEEILNESQ